MYVAAVNSLSSTQPSSFLTNRNTILLAALVFATSLSVRLYKLDGQTLECDELYTLPAATGHQYVYLSHEANAAPTIVPVTIYEYKNLLKPEAGFGLGAVTAVLKRNVHLPAYFFLMHYWMELFGNSEFALRLPAAIFGALAAFMLFFLGKELFGLLPGVVSAVLMALSPEQIYFSQQARMYSLLALLTILSTYMMVLIGRRLESPWLYFCYALISVAGLYTHYEYAFALPRKLLMCGWVRRWEDRNQPAG